MAYQILGDVHTHTLYSRHAYSTIAENVAAAAEAGLELLGSTDHFSDMIYADMDIRNFQYLANTGTWPRTWKGVTLLRGCEADIVSLKGELFGQSVPMRANIVGMPEPVERSLFDRVTAPMDYLIASVHNNAFADGASIVETTEMYIGALQQPRVFILGHTGRAGVPFDVDEVVTFAKEHHKLIEINEHSLEFDGSGAYRSVCGHIAERCAELGCGISVSSDAHVAPLIGQYTQVRSMLEEIHFPEELIMDRGREPFLRELAAAGLRDLTSLP